MVIQYEIECSHCGYVFTVEASALTRLMKCTVCGGVLSVAVPVPIAIETPPPAPPPPLPPLPTPTLPVEETPDPPLEPDRPELDSLHPDLRARFLCEPWRSVYHALNGAKMVADFTFPLSVLLAALDLFFCPLAMPIVHDREVQMLNPGLAVFLVIPALIHALHQKNCLLVPPAYGQWSILGSLILILPACGALGWATFSTDVPAKFIGPLLGVISFLLWLSFLERLGQRFADYTLTNEARSYIVWFGVGFIAIVGLFGGSFLSAKEGNLFGAWICRVVASMVGVLLLRGYSTLMHSAALTVASHGPVAPES